MRKRVIVAVLLVVFLVATVAPVGAGPRPPLLPTRSSLVGPAARGAVCTRYQAPSTWPRAAWSKRTCKPGW